MGMIGVPHAALAWQMAGDKLSHLAAFLAISAAWTYSLLSVHSMSKMSAGILSIGLGLAVSASNEIMQTYSPARDALSTADMAADAAGYVAGTLVALSIPLFKSQRRKIPRS